MGSETKVTFWDTAGQERFQSMTPSHYRNAHAIMLVFDVSSRDSFYSLEKSWREYNAYGNVRSSVAIVVGNKTDLDRTVSEEEARAWAVQKSLFYDEVSAKNNDGISRTVDTLIRQMGELPEVKRESIRLKTAPTSDRCCY
jgi:Ras-related protein Rab-18